MKMLPLMLSAALLLGCDRKPVDNPEPPVPVDGPVATVYTTSVAKERFTESTLPLGKPEDVHFYKVERSGETFQEVDSAWPSPRRAVTTCKRCPRKTGPLS